MVEYPAHDEAASLDKLVIEVKSVLLPDVLRRRPEHVNVLLRLSMMSGLQMQLGSTLGMLCDFCKEIVPHELALVYFWNEAQEKSQLRVPYELPEAVKKKLTLGNILDYWSMKYGKPMVVKLGDHAKSDELLNALRASAALSVPVLVHNRVMGSMQFFSSKPDAFQVEDAQLLWMLSRIAENLLNREHASEGLIQFAFTDYLTGLKTRGYFEQQLEVEIKRAERTREKFGLLMLDIDHFKEMNDKFGHHLGDQVLRELSSVLVKDMREVDTVARYGGEEFVILLPDANEEEALAVAERIRRSVEQATFLREGTVGEVALSISIGVAVFEKGTKSKRELVQSADAALYWAKGQGRNQVISYSQIANEPQREAS